MLPADTAAMGRHLVLMAPLATAGEDTAAPPAPHPQPIAHSPASSLPVDLATPAGMVATYLGIGVHHLAGTSELVLDMLAARLMGDRRRAAQLRLLLESPSRAQSESA